MMTARTKKKSMRLKNNFFLLTLVFIMVGLLGTFTLAKASTPPAGSSSQEHRLPQFEWLATPDLAFRINAAGGDYTDSSGNLFVADKAYTPGGFGYIGGKAFSTSTPISNTSDAPLFQSQRFDSSLSYLFDNLPTGDYFVTLHFAEIQFTAPEMRIFHVFIEGNLLLPNYDIFVAAGRANSAISETFLVPVADGQLHIIFNTVAQRSAIAAIEVVSNTLAEPAPDIAVSPEILDFGTVELVSSSERTAIISNVGVLDLSVSSLITTNSAYSVVSPAAPFTITAGSNLSLTLRFTPDAVGIQNGSLQIASNDPDESQFNISLVGNAVEPTYDPDIAASGVIRIMPLGDSITLGSSSGESDPAGFVSYRRALWESLASAGHYVDFVGSLLNGQLYSDFDPDHEGHAGWRDDKVAASVYSFLTANPSDVVLLHIGTNGLDPSPVDVENILNEIDRFEADTDTPVTVVLARIINRAKYSADTTAFNNNVATMAQNRIAAGDDIVMVDMENGAGINYARHPKGDLWDMLHPYLTGYNKMAAVWMNALSTVIANVRFGDVEVGTYSDQVIVISNLGAGDLNVYSVSTSNAAFSIVSPSIPIIIPPGTDIPVTVRFTPDAHGAQNGTLQVTSDDPDESQFSLSLAGHGVEPATGGAGDLASTTSTGR